MLIKAQSGTQFHMCSMEMMPKAFLICLALSRHHLGAFQVLLLFSCSLLLFSLKDRMPFPGKLESPLSWNFLRHRYNKNGSIPNSCASSETFLRSKLNLTAFSLNALSKCIRCFLMIHKSKLLCLSNCPI